MRWALQAAEKLGFASVLLKGTRSPVPQVPQGLVVEADLLHHRAVGGAAIGIDRTRLNSEPGDRLVLYTDGIIEAAGERAEEFGQTRLQALLSDGLRLSAQETADRIIHSVQRWSKTQDDDLTVLVCDYAASAHG